MIPGYVVRGRPDGAQVSEERGRELADVPQRCLEVEGGRELDARPGEEPERLLGSPAQRDVLDCDDEVRWRAVVPGNRGGTQLRPDDPPVPMREPHLVVLARCRPARHVFVALAEASPVLGVNDRQERLPAELAVGAPE